LLVVVAILYLGAWLLATRFRFLADAELAAPTEPDEVMPSGRALSPG
jgi:hypothetical protein